VQIEQNTTPSDFGQYPNILGAGPLLLQNRQIVLDAKSEQFSDAFVRQSAIRSCVGRTATGSLILVAIHNRSGGLGPNLTETAQLMQKLGAIDALNFDGGSSTGLFLGGQLLDRSSYTAARVHNGLGIFRAPFPQYK
jgi:exopolysaccharide biosynthesis protein